MRRPLKQASSVMSTESRSAFRRDERRHLLVLSNYYNCLFNTLALYNEISLTRSKDELRSGTQKHVPTVEMTVYAVV